MKHQEKFDISQIPPWKIIVVTTSMPDYGMGRVILVQDHPERGDWLLIHGYHCSCYGFDETEWDATWYTKDELLKILEKWPDSDRQAERLAVGPIALYLLEIDDDSHYMDRYIKPLEKYGFAIDRSKEWGTTITLFPGKKEGTNE